MNTPGIDFRHTQTNHIIEMEEVLGIEAARQSIINEIKYTMESHGMKIDIRHIQLLADVMTFKGKILGINRHGVHKMKNSTLMLASFEMTTDHLYDAAAHCKIDEITGVSECIITGNLVSLGSGAFKLCMDQSLAQPNVPNPNPLTKANPKPFIQNYKVETCKQSESRKFLFDSL